RDRLEVDADLVLCTHLHDDHTQVGVIEDADKKIAKGKLKVIKGLKDERGDGKKGDWNLVDEKFKDGRRRNGPLFHDTEQGLKRGKNSAFVIEADGLRIVHLGDLGHVLTKAQLETFKRMGPIDVLMVPVGGVYTLNGTDAKTVVDQLKPRQYIVPMHFGIK